MNDQPQALIHHARKDQYFTDHPKEYGKLMKFVREFHYPRKADFIGWLIIKTDWLLYCLNPKEHTPNTVQEVEA